MKKGLRVLAIESGVSRRKMPRDTRESLTLQDSGAGPIRGKPVVLDVPIAETFFGEPHAAKFEQSPKLRFRGFCDQIIARRNAWNTGCCCEIAELLIFRGPASHDRVEASVPSSLERRKKSARIFEQVDNPDVQTVTHPEFPDPFKVFRTLDDDALSSAREREIESPFSRLLLNIMQDLANLQTTRCADRARNADRFFPGPVVLAEECRLWPTAEDIASPGRSAVRRGQNKYGRLFRRGSASAPPYGKRNATTG